MSFEKYYKLWKHISPKRRFQYYQLLILIIITSFAEVLSIGAVIPFLGALTSPEEIFKIEKLNFVWSFLNINSSKEITLPFTLLFVIGSIFSGGMRLLLMYISNIISNMAGAEISINIYKKTLYQSYSVHVGRNSSDIISGIMNKSSGIIGYVMQPILTIISSSIILIIILIGLLIIDPVICITSFGIFGLLYFIVAGNAKKKLLKNGKIVSENLNIIYKSLQEGLGGIRDVLLDGSQKFYTDLYKKSDIPYRRATAENVYLSGSPRFIMEAFGMAGMALFAYSLSATTESLLTVVPILGSLALGAQRMLPILQQMYSSWAIMKSGSSVLNDVLDLLDQKLPDYVDNPPSLPLKFTESIEIRDLGFRYGVDLPFILKNFNLRIKKGSRVGFIGKTGSGKSTLIDLIMGLLSPTEGKIIIDGIELNGNNLRAWQMNIAHVPQTIFLSDSSIAENIAFGIPKEEINYNKIEEVAKKAQIADHINSLTQGYNTQVGERGIRLSGGQKQRIGIARALYKNASLIVFDEATSALDTETEKAVMESIEALDKDLTLIIIAHRLSTVEKCDSVIEIR